MKRLILIALSISLMLSLAACGSAPAPTEPPLFSGEDVTAPTQTATEAPQPTETVPPTEAAYEIQDAALESNENCSFTITNVEYNEHLGLQINVLCENFTDRSLTFSWNGASVCGFMYDPYWAEEVAPNKKVNSTVSIDTYALEQIGIDSVDQITFTLLVLDSEEFMNEPLVQKEYTIYPTGKSPEQVILPQYQHTADETVIADNEVLTFIVMNVDDELADYYTLNCYISNNTDKDLLISWEDVSVNGFMVNPFWALSVSAGKQAYVEIIFFRSDLEKQDIEVVQDIEFTLQVTDADTWDDVYQLTATFKPVL